MTYDEERALASVAHDAIREMRARRRWRIFFRIVWLTLLIAFIWRLWTAEKDNNVAASTHIGVVEIHGVIAAGMSANADDIIDALEKVFQTDSAEAVVLDINSPGGSPVQSAQVYRAIRQLRQQYHKPVYAVISDVGASGAYYIAAAADEIYADPASIVGSIGVISQSIGVTDLLQKIGVESRTFKSGAHKDFLNPAQKLQADEVAHMNAVLNNVHQQFIQAVRAGRGHRLHDSESNQLFSGLFWSGEQAKALGLVDGLASIRELVAEKYGERTPIRIYSPDLTPWQQLARDLSAHVQQSIQSLLGERHKVSAVLAE